MSVLARESAEPVSDRRTLVEYFEHAARPREEWLIGCEHEKFPFRLSTLKPVTYGEPQGLRDFLNAMGDFGWKPVMEGENIIGLSRGKSAISFEPGGQVELAGAPWSNLHEVAAETDQHLEECRTIGDKLGIGFLGMGFHPTAKREDIEFVPKQRYRIMSAYMPKVGTHGLDMMLRTCTVQVNLDFGSEDDMRRKMRIGLALQPIATALFASSPFLEKKPSGFNSMRMRVWFDTDNARSGPIPFVFDESFGYERYTDYALDVPMYFVFRGGKYIECAGQSFRDFLAGKLPALPGEHPTLNDWANHLTTIFPDVRLKKIIEMRGADSGSAEMLKALPAFWTGLLYDSVAMNDAETLIKEWNAEDRAKLHNDAPRLGFQAEIKGRSLRDIAKAAVTISQQGLRRRMVRLHGGVDETRYLEILFDMMDSGQNRSDYLLMQGTHFPDFKMESVFASERLLPGSNS